jgi:potassium channel subfamily K
MASFALQAITQVFTRVSEWRLNSRREEQGLVPQSPDEPVITHAEYLARHHRRYDEMFPRSGTRNSAADSDETVHERALREHGDSEERDGGRADRVLSPNGATHGHQSTAQRDQAVVETVQDANQRLVREMLERAIALEAHARRMLIRHLPNGGRAQVVLKADRNVQLRDLRFLQRREQGAHQGKAPAHTGDGAHTGETQDTEVARHGRAVDTANDTEKDPGELRRELDVDDGDEDWVSEPLDEEATLREVRAYRDNFAALLVAGTRLKQLEGDEMVRRAAWALVRGLTIC